MPRSGESRGRDARNAARTDKLTIEYIMIGFAVCICILSQKGFNKITALVFIIGSLCSGQIFVSAFMTAVVSGLVLVLKNFISPQLRVPVVDMTGRTVIVTGANSGCGKETARLLFSYNATVIMACRDVAAGERAAKEIRKQDASEARRILSVRERKERDEKPRAQILVEHLDLASFKSVRSFVRRFESSGRTLNVLINNAGVRTSSLVTTTDAIELHYQVNHLGHFLLTNLLLDSLEVGAKVSETPSRVVHVTSSAHAYGAVPEAVYSAGVRNIDAELFQQRMSAHVEGVYGDTKLMQVIFSNELDRRMVKEKRPIRSYAVHPGFVATNFGSTDRRWLQTLLVFLRPLIARNAKQGAMTSVFGAVATSLQSRGGIYLDNCKFAIAGKAAHDRAKAAWLWETSAKIVALGQDDSLNKTNLRAGTTIAPLPPAPHPQSVTPPHVEGGGGSGNPTKKDKDV